MLSVFQWEHATITFMRELSRSGLFYDFMRFISDLSQTKWIILAVLAFLLLKLGWRKLTPPLIFSLVAVGLGDLISRRIVKSFFMRPRPEFYGEVCDMSSCWGLVSSHATNLFAVVAVLYFYDRKTLIWSFPIAVSVSFSRVYLIEHFPMDVIGGAIMGFTIGWMIYFLFSLSVPKKLALNIG